MYLLRNFHHAKSTLLHVLLSCEVDNGTYRRFSFFLTPKWISPEWNRHPEWCPHLIIEWHDKYPTDSEQVLHVVFMFRWTRCPAVDTIIKPPSGCQQQTVAHHKLGVTELKLVKARTVGPVVLHTFLAVLHHISMLLHAMVHTIRTWDRGEGSYRKVFNIRGNKSQNLNVSCLL